MIKFENTEVVGWEAAIRGMRNPMNSWEKGDSGYCKDFFSALIDGASCDKRCPRWSQNSYCGYSEDMTDRPEWDGYMIGQTDHKLMMSLAKGGPVHAKYRRMIVAYVDITAPLYWWKEFDTYKVGTVANSCSTMHKIHEKEFALEDFSCEHLIDWKDDWTCDCLINEGVSPDGHPCGISPVGAFHVIFAMLNTAREKYLETKDKKYWWQMIQLLPSSYNQRRTVMLNYEVLAGIYSMRKNHKLDEWHDFCHWIEKLPYSEVITGERGDSSTQVTEN